MSTIRLATFDNLQSIVDIYNQSIPDRKATADLQPVKLEDRIAWFESHNAENRPLYVLTEGEAVLGFLSVQDFYEREAYKQTVELGLYIDKNHRNKGLAVSLLKNLEAEAEKRKIATATAFIFKHNQESIHLFTQMEYQKWGELPAIACLDNQWATLLIFGKHLSSHPIQNKSSLFA
jgi:L-amino acid N-acyltransferase YncA